MKKEETLTYLKAYLDGDTAIGNIIPLRSVLESALEYLEHSLPSNLDEAAEEYADETYYVYPPEFLEFVKEEIRDAFIAGAKWQKGQLLKGSPLPEDTVLFQKGVEEGRRLEREDIMKDAVECSVYAGKEGGKWIVSYIGNYDSMMKICKGCDKVRLIVLPKENEK